MAEVGYASLDNDVESAGIFVENMGSYRLTRSFAIALMHVRL